MPDARSADGEMGRRVWGDGCGGIRGDGCGGDKEDKEDKEARGEKKVMSFEWVSFEWANFSLQNE
ncbi:MAG: hypothetical protein ACHBN1_03210 [Heteroscytonema crispum UTEX LB 1556]